MVSDLPLGPFTVSWLHTRLTIVGTAVQIRTDIPRWLWPALVKSRLTQFQAANLKTPLGSYVASKQFDHGWSRFHYLNAGAFLTVSVGRLFSGISGQISEPVSMIWGIYFNLAHRVPPFPNSVYFTGFICRS